MGRRQLAFAENAAALRLDPVSPVIINTTAALLSDERRFEEAMQDFQKTIELDPGFSDTYFSLADTLMHLGRCGEAVPNLVKGLQLVGQVERAAAVEQGLAQGGCRKAFENDLAMCRKRIEREYVDPGTLAFDYLQLGDKDHALEWLERAFREKSGSAQFLKVDLRWESLHSDPRFQSILRRMNFPSD
jgi:tetratricopeptide (TPR) repeat protein